MIKQKSWIWWLTVFANPTMTTTIYPDIYVSENFYNLKKESQERILKHEQIHLQQQKEVGLMMFLFLYVFCFPLFWNPWRYRWEYDAYVQSGTSKEHAREVLQSWKYGFLH